MMELDTCSPWADTNTGSMYHWSEWVPIPSASMWTSDYEIVADTEEYGQWIIGDKTIGIHSLHGICGKYEYRNRRQHARYHQSMFSAWVEIDITDVKSAAS